MESKRYETDEKDYVEYFNNLYDKNVKELKSSNILTYVSNLFVPIGVGSYLIGEAFDSLPLRGIGLAATALSFGGLYYSNGKDRGAKLGKQIGKMDEIRQRANNEEIEKFVNLPENIIFFDPRKN